MSEREKALNENRPGYKKTKVGWIPEEWECVKFAEVSNLVRGPFGGALKKEIFVPSGFKVYEQQHAIYGDFNAGEYFLDEECYINLKRFSLQPGDIIMSCSGTAGRFAIFPSDAKPGVINQALLKIRPQKQIITINFLYYFFNSQFFQRNLFADFAGGAIKNIAGMPIIKKIPIPLPPLPEQKKIAEILSAWDRAVEITNRLITNYELLKKGLMQQLLSGRMRFPEFVRSEKLKVKSEKLKKGGLPEGWNLSHLKSLAKMTAGGTPSTRADEYWGGGIPWMNSGELNHRRVYEVEGRITQKGLENSSAKMLPIHSVLIGLAGQGKTRATVAINEIPLCTNQSVAAIIPKEKDLSFLYLYHHLDSRYDELRRLSAGDGGRGGLNLGLLGSLKIPLPSGEEQHHIAAVLSTCDHEIQLLTQKCDRLKEQKKGLMQKLLTGEIRVRVKSEKLKVQS